MNRPVNYERALWEWNTDMYVPQYPSAEWLEEIGRKGSDRSGSSFGVFTCDG